MDSSKSYIYWVYDSVMQTIRAMHTNGDITDDAFDKLVARLDKQKEHMLDAVK